MANHNNKIKLSIDTNFLFGFLYIDVSIKDSFDNVDTKNII